MSDLSDVLSAIYCAESNDQHEKVAGLPRYLRGLSEEVRFAFRGGDWIKNRILSHGSGRSAANAFARAGKRQKLLSVASGALDDAHTPGSADWFAGARKLGAENADIREMEGLGYALRRGGKQLKPKPRMEEAFPESTVDSEAALKRRRFAAGDRIGLRNEIASKRRDVEIREKLRSLGIAPSDTVLP